MGFNVSQKDQVLNPSFLFPGFSRSTDSVDRSLKSVDRAVDRRAQTCTPLCTGGPVDRQRASALWKTPADRSCRPTERLLSVPVARSTERSIVAPTVGKMTVGGRPAGRPAVMTDPNGYIFWPINWGSCHLFWG